jgi:tetratricopeptide (TPR) repeat protein
MNAISCFGKRLFLIVLLFSSSRLPAQLSRLDSLKKNITDSRTNTARLQAAMAFCEEWESYNPDTLYKYALLVQQLSAEQKNAEASLMAEYYLAAWLFQKNKLDTALKKVDESFAKLRRISSYNEDYYKFYGLRANILTRTIRMDELIAQDIEMLKLGEEHNDTLLILRGKIGIGNANLKLHKYDEALNWYYQVISLMQNPEHKKKLSFFFNNVAITFYHLEKEDSCKFYLRQALRYSHEEGNLTSEANSLFLYGSLLTEFKKIPEAEQAYKKALEARKKIGDIYYTIADLCQVASFYASFKKPQLGIALCK